MVKKLVTRAEFATRAGVSGAAVTKACASALQDAVDGKRIDAGHPAARRYVKKHARDKTPSAATGLDPLYEQAVELCQTTGRFTASTLQRGLKIGYKRAVRVIEQIQAVGVTAATARAQPLPAVTAKPETLPDDPPDGMIEIPEDIQMFLDFTLRELLGKFGTSRSFIDWLTATKAIEVINEKRLKNAKTEGELVARDRVKRGVIDPIDGVFSRMLIDGAKTIASRSHALVKADGSVNEVRELVEDQLGSFIRPAKVKMMRALRDA